MAVDVSQKPIIATTQDFLDVVDVVNGIVITRDGTFCVIIQTTSVNFELLSEDEQGFKIEAFGGLINSLDFTMQILIETHKVNITNYINYLNSLDGQKRSPGLMRQFLIYKKFVTNLIIKNEILEKRFLLVVPYRSGALITETMPLDQKRKYFEAALNYLSPKRNHLIKQLGRLGLSGHQWTSREVVEYFYEVFNPGQKINIQGYNIEDE
jgi:hypothetical protein